MFDWPFSFHRLQTKHQKIFEQIDGNRRRNELFNSLIDRQVFFSTSVGRTYEQSRFYVAYFFGVPPVCGKIQTSFLDSRVSLSEDKERPAVHEQVKYEFLLSKSHGTTWRL